MKKHGRMGKKMSRFLFQVFALLCALAVSGAPAASLYFVHTDHLGTPQKITDSAQQVVWEGNPMPFGETEVVVNQIDFHVRFPGQYFDGEAGLHYNYFRDYDPAIGRYITSDPIGLDGGINTYAYVSGNPIRFFDPYGLEKWDWDGWGDTSVCKYYQDLADKTGCNYYSQAAEICRGENPFVNGMMNAAISQAWLGDNTNASRSEIANQIRSDLISYDGTARALNNRGNYPPRGDHIDMYHNMALKTPA